MDFIEILKDINGRFEKAMKGYNNPSTGRPREAHGGGPPEEEEEESRPSDEEEARYRQAFKALVKLCEEAKKNSIKSTEGKQ